MFTILREDRPHKPLPRHRSNVLLFVFCWRTYYYIITILARRHTEYVILCQAPRAEESRLQIFTTAKNPNKFSRESPWHSNKFSLESRIFKEEGFTGVSGVSVTQTSARKPRVNLEIEICQVWSPPWAVSMCNSSVGVWLMREWVCLLTRLFSTLR